MRVPAVNLNNLNSQIKSNSANHGVRGNNLANGERQISDLKGMPYVYPVNFTAIQNSSKLRILFSYGLPCMYSGIQMIDPKQLSRMLKNQTFFQPSSSVVEILSKYRESFTGIEAKVFDILCIRTRIFRNYCKKLNRFIAVVCVKNKLRFSENLQKQLMHCRKNTNVRSKN